MIFQTRILALAAIFVIIYGQLSLAASSDGNVKATKTKPTPVNRSDQSHSPISFHLVLPSSSDLGLADRKDQGPIDPNQWKIISDIVGAPVFIRKKPLLTGIDILKVSVVKPDKQARGFQQTICLNVEGGYKLADFSRKHTGKPLAIVVDNVVLMKPVIMTDLLGGNLSINSGSQITANETLFARFQTLEGRRKGKQVDADKLCNETAFNGRALSYLNAAINNGDQSVELLLDRAQRLQTAGKLRKASADFNIILKRDPENTEALFGRSDVLVLQEKYDLAMRDIDKVFAINPKYEGLFLQRGYTYQKLKKYKLAIADFNVTIQRYPEIYVAYGLRADAHMDIGQHQLALVDYSKAIELESNLSENYNNRAWFYFKMGLLKKGIVDVDRALKLDPSSGYAFDTRGHLYEALGQKEKAIKDFQKALHLEPDSQESKDGLKRLGVR